MKKSVFIVLLENIMSGFAIETDIDYKSLNDYHFILPIILKADKLASKHNSQIKSIRLHKEGDLLLGKDDFLLKKDDIDKIRDSFITKKFVKFVSVTSGDTILSFRVAGVLDYFEFEKDIKIYLYFSEKLSIYKGLVFKNPNYTVNYLPVDSLSNYPLPFLSTYKNYIQQGDR